ncbi:hypothetical protein FNV43_RR00652 [Rhamnella rubrinervis]|uniref:Uncharacterized protein n=1 Tax=Rhamnella rubrinervis TaxID=2594499 RepID=A0A8K0HPJ9_9ROSA|nr:hypothetical protein FNV43_RR00652 [Rhamnella rubrinervis]
MKRNWRKQRMKLHHPQKTHTLVSALPKFKTAPHKNPPASLEVDGESGRIRGEGSWGLWVVHWTRGWKWWTATRWRTRKWTTAAGTKWVEEVVRRLWLRVCGWCPGLWKMLAKWVEAEWGVSRAREEEMQIWSGKKKRRERA